MIIDGHIHITNGPVEPKKLLECMHKAGVDGGMLFSLPPPSFKWLWESGPARARLDNLLAWVQGCPTLYPIFWIDPLEADALDQVKMAGKAGVRGFKVICNRFYPGNPQAVEVFKAIAAIGKPIFFHSGILWDGADSSRYNRPVEFEAMLDIDRLKFSLAHISWPWCDEHIAVYGKFQNAYQRRPDLSVEMFVDMTPGTPPIYRQDALTKLFGVGYPVAKNVFFGSDCLTNNYSADTISLWVKTDNAIYAKMKLPKETIANIYSNNVLRFINAT